MMAVVVGKANRHVVTINDVLDSLAYKIATIVIDPSKTNAYRITTAYG